MTERERIIKELLTRADKGAPAPLYIVKHAAQSIQVKKHKTFLPALITAIAITLLFPITGREAAFQPLSSAFPAHYSEPYCDGSCNCPDCPAHLHQLNASAEWQGDKQQVAFLSEIMAGKFTALDPDLTLTDKTLQKVIDQEQVLFFLGNKDGNETEVAVKADNENMSVFVF